jgi:small subunit ribosomal protein S6
MSRRYETVYIFDSALDEPAINEKLERFHALLTKGGKGTLTNVAHWGKRTLAFPVKKKESGHYVVAQFEAAGDLLPEYERVVRLDEGVLRYLVVVNEGEPVKPAAPSAPAIAGDDDEGDDEEEV